MGKTNHNGSDLCAWRKRRGLSITEVAAAWDKNPRTIKNIEDGVSKLETLHRCGMIVSDLGLLPLDHVMVPKDGIPLSARKHWSRFLADNTLLLGYAKRIEKLDSAIAFLSDKRAEAECAARNAAAVGWGDDEVILAMDLAAMHRAGITTHLSAEPERGE